MFRWRIHAGVAALVLVSVLRMAGQGSVRIAVDEAPIRVGRKAVGVARRGEQYDVVKRGEHDWVLIRFGTDGDQRQGWISESACQSVGGQRPRRPVIVRGEGGGKSLPPTLEETLSGLVGQLLAARRGFGVIARVRGTRAYIDLGAADGVVAGDMFEIVRRATAASGQAAGEIQGGERDVAGRLQVVAAQENLAVCTLVDGAIEQRNAAGELNEVRRPTGSTWLEVAIPAASIADDVPISAERLQAALERACTGAAELTVVPVADGGHAIQAEVTWDREACEISLALVQPASSHVVARAAGRHHTLPRISPLPAGTLQEQAAAFWRRWDVFTENLRRAEEAFGKHSQEVKSIEAQRLGASAQARDLAHRIEAEVVRTQGLQAQHVAGGRSQDGSAVGGGYQEVLALRNLISSLWLGLLPPQDRRRFRQNPVVLAGDALEWEQCHGEWSFDGGVVCVTRQADPECSNHLGQVVLGGVDAMDYSVRVKLMPQGHCDDCGVIFRAIDRDNFYCLSISERDLMVRKSGEWDLRWTIDETQHAVSWSLVEIRLRGPRITILADGRQIAEVIDSTFARGRVGLRTYTSRDRCFSDCQQLVDVAP